MGTNNLNWTAIDWGSEKAVKGGERGYQYLGDSADSIGPTVGLGLPTAIDLGKATGLGSGKGLDVGVISITTAGDLKIPNHKFQYVDCECVQ
ncbi:MAG: hypothetical protein MI725_13210 [Pirellulales bacterium]|nr:hypothetical protein [Pirellulales bacterium]